MCLKAYATNYPAKSTPYPGVLLKEISII